MLSLHTTFKVLAFVLSSLCFLSCSNHSKQDIEIIKALSESIESSNKWIERSTAEVMLSLRNKMEESGASERAKVWYPRAERIQQLSKDIYDYIESLKQKIKDTAINRHELFEKLKKYREQLLQVDSSIKKQFEGSLNIYTQTIDSSKDDHQKLFEVYFNNVFTEAVVAMLKKVQSNIRFNEMRLVTFCNEHAGIIEIIDYSVTYFTILNSNVFKPRDTVEITAGIIVFDKRYNSQFFVYDREIDTEDDGFAHYKLQAATEPGNYYLPIKIMYTDQYGIQRVIQKQIEYTVANIQKQ